MAELTVDMTYGSALFQAAQDIGKVDEMEDELSAVSDILGKNPEFASLIDDPTISAGEKKTVLKNVFDGRIMPELLNFMYVLVDKGRTRHFQRIVREYGKLRNQEEGFVAGTVYSVEPLDSGQIDRLQKETSKIINRKVKLENKIDPSLIGGVKILADGRLIDASLKKRLESLGESIRM